MNYLKSQDLAEQLRQSIKAQTIELIEQRIEPQLAVILIGNNNDSLTYVALKTRIAKELGIIVSLYHMDAETPFSQVEETIKFLNNDSDIHGIIIQLPLPDLFTSDQTDTLLTLVSPKKDVDGLSGAWESDSSTPSTTSHLLHNLTIIPPMVSAVISLLDFYKIEFRDKKVVLVGKGRLVGAPLESFFKKVGASVISVDEETENILEATKQADILISGTGENDLITYQWIKEGAVVIDCANDIHEDSVIQVASSLSPSKGGVGPLTVLWLLHNTVQMARLNGETHV